MPSESGSNEIQALIPKGRHVIELITKDTDLNKPIISFLKPTKNIYNVGGNILVNGEAEDMDGQALNMDLFFDGKYVKPAGGYGRWWERHDPILGNLKAGKHTLKLLAKDSNGKISEATKTILVGTPPAVSFARPTNDTFKVGDELGVLAAISDAENNFKKVELFFDGKPVKSSPWNKKEWWHKYDPLMRNLRAGRHVLKLVATDDIGMTSEVTKTILVGNPPTVSFIDQVTIFKVGGNVAVSAEADDTDGKVVNVDLFFDGTYVKRARGRGWWERHDPILGNLKAGKHLLKLVATDNIGMTSEATMTILVGSPPEVSFARPTTDIFKVGGELGVLAGISDAENNFKKVELFFDGKRVKSSPVNKKEWWHKYDPLMRNLQAGKHILKLIATDDLGMTSEVTKTILVGSPPEVSFVRPTTDTFKVGDELGVLAAISDAENNFKKVELFFDGKRVKSSPVNKKEWWHKYDPLMRNLQAGEHVLKLVAIDDLGMSSETSKTILVGTNSLLRESSKNINSQPNKYNKSFTRNNELIKVYPNPVTGDYFIIDLGDDLNMASKISIFDMQGRLVYENQVSDMQKIEIERKLLNNVGLYFIEITQNNFRHLQKILIK